MLSCWNKPSTVKPSKQLNKKILPEEITLGVNEPVKVNNFRSGSKVYPIVPIITVECKENDEKAQLKRNCDETFDPYLSFLERGGLLEKEIKDMQGFAENKKDSDFNNDDKLIDGIISQYEKQIPKTGGLPKNRRVICGKNFDIKEKLLELDIAPYPDECIAFVYWKSEQTGLKIWVLKKCHPNQTGHDKLAINTQRKKCFNGIEFDLKAAGEIVKEADEFKIYPKTGQFYNEIENFDLNIHYLSHETGLKIKPVNNLTITFY